jgi:hypothetical protein
MESILNTILPFQRQSLARINLDRSYNKRDPSGVYELDTIRDMKKVRSGGLGL